jgi:hypothetical protein
MAKPFNKWIAVIIGIAILGIVLYFLLKWG